MDDNIEARKTEHIKIAEIIFTVFPDNTMSPIPTGLKPDSRNLLYGATFSVFFPKNKAVGIETGLNPSSAIISMIFELSSKTSLCILEKYLFVLSFNS